MHDVVPIVCTVVIVAATISRLVGRAHPAPPVKNFVGEGASVRPAVKSVVNSTAWFIRYLFCSRAAASVVPAFGIPKVMAADFKL